MFDYLIRRLLLIIPTLFGITLVVFTVISLAPGDPGALRMDDFADPEVSERLALQLRERFHLDEPVLKRYGMWLSSLVTGDLGLSMADETPVYDKIANALWPTLKVNIAALILAFFISMPIGIRAAARQNGLFDRTSGTLLYMLYSLPSYVGAIVLILFLGVKWDWLPFGGQVGDMFDKLTPMGKFLDILAHMTMYLICSFYGSLAYYSRFIRQNMLEVVRQDYVRTARAKGLSERTVIVKHAFRNTLIPFVTMIGLIVPFLLGGSVILEVLFTWPGMGRLFFTSILERDFTVIMALSTATAVMVLFANLAVDILYGFVDPRVIHR